MEVINSLGKGNFIETDFEGFMEEIKNDNIKSFWADETSFSIKDMEKLGKVIVEYSKDNSSLYIWIDAFLVTSVSINWVKKIQYYTK